MHLQKGASSFSFPIICIRAGKRVNLQARKVCTTMTLPTEFADYTRALMGEALYAVLERGMQEEAPVSVRLNPFKTDGKLEGSEPVPWCPWGYWLEDRPAFTFDPLLHAGLYYVQEASSMFVCEAVRQCAAQGLLPSGALLAADLCAAPGGKTTALRSVLPEGSLLFSNEPMKQRASILKENIIKFGHPDIIVTNNYPRDYRKTGLAFDLILTDVPCSGEGMFRKDAGAVDEWSVQNVEKCRQLQRSIVEDIWPCLKPGGMLIYSTCTFNAHEDEENVQWIADNLGADVIPLETPTAWNITGPLTGTQPCCRFIPGRTHGEGLFMAVLRKHDEAGDKTRNSQAGSGKAKKGNGEHRKWLNPSFGPFAETEEKGTVRALPLRWADIYNNVKKQLHVIHAGIALGTVKGRDLVPDVSLALSTALNQKAFPEAELSYDDAIRYLRKEAVTLPADAPRGFTLVTYRQQPLGFVKNIGNRANNLYPQEWKIKSSHIPTSASSLPCHPIEP